MPALKILHPGSSIAYASYRHLTSHRNDESPNSEVSYCQCIVVFTSSENLRTTQIILKYNVSDLTNMDIHFYNVNMKW